jgi:N-acetylglucosaminyldiphosphoundecaprenol N-acetyl-beta-D-mannosaminyltransferase
LFLALFILVKVTSPGPFLFRQKRRGFKGEPFEILKIRTMSLGSEKRTALGVQNTDPSISPVGRTLRALKLDELPQLWNIVIGEMELVGPRPVPMALEDELTRNIPGFEQRHRVKPGLTNVAQVSVMDNELGGHLIRDWTLRLEAERHYIDNKSFAYDVILVFMTGLYILRKFSRRASDEAVEQGMLPATEVIGVPISNLDYQGVVNQVAYWLQSEAPHRYVGVCPVHNIIEAWQDPEHRKILVEADLNTADGVPIVWSQRLLGHRRATRVYGPTLMLHTLRRAEQEGWRVALYGGHPKRMPFLQEKLLERFPRLIVVFAESPPFRPLTEEEDQEVVGRMNAARPDLIWVGLGCPKQERWMAEHSSRIRGVMFGVGAAFDFHCGMLRQAPSWTQRMGLEWAFRLACEPRRLFKRYATTNPLFVLLLTKQWLGKVFLRRKAQRVLNRRNPALPLPEAALKGRSCASRS